jgi:hypothetical protein
VICPEIADAKRVRRSATDVLADRSCIARVLEDQQAMPPPVD